MLSTRGPAAARALLGCFCPQALAANPAQLQVDCRQAAASSPTPLPLSSAGYAAAAAAAGIVPDHEVGPGGGGQSQEKAKQMKRRLAPYDPQHHKQGVSVVHKHGPALLWDPWYNKGGEGGEEGGREGERGGEGGREGGGVL